ncbi:flagellar basal body rod protein FlgF [Dongshaea marina]|uniref:flagellar basal body rod protein FlgF n=1 Tax=Dongshaea marina TaxID=2047966 RepID=UPI000D3E960C|nr:flagellar basal body rod protein FlgF [Dongshaea marina]
MDRSLYTAMTGASAAMQVEALHSNNLANANTPGFQAAIALADSQPVEGDGWHSRTMAAVRDGGLSGRSGDVIVTGRALDVKPSEGGYLAVMDPSGKEAYTRDGSIQVNASGEMTIKGLPVIGSSGGPIMVPSSAQLHIGEDGTISMEQTAGQGMVELDQLKLVQASPRDLERSSSCLIYGRDGKTFGASSAIRVRSEALEGSNVNPVEEMVTVMSSSRQFEMQLKMMETAKTLEQSGDSLLRSPL